MIIRSKSNYIVPIQYVQLSDLGIDDKTIGLRLDSHSGPMDEAKDNLENSINYLFFRVRDLLSLITKDNAFPVYQEIVKSILNSHIKYVPCFAVIKEESISGMNMDEVINMHLSKFEEVYTIHANEFNYNEETEKNKNLISYNSLKLKVENIKNSIDMIFKKITNMADRMSMDEVLNLHISILKTIMKLLVNNIECLEEKRGSFNGMSLKEVITMHINDFKKMFILHYNLLKCK